MSFVPLPNGVRVALEYSLNGELLFNIYHVTKPTPIVTADLTAIAQIFRDWWLNSGRNQFADNMSLLSLTATDISSEDSIQHVNTVSPPVTGLQPTDNERNSQAIVVSWRTARIGRSYRGRTYMAGTPSNGVTANNITVTRATNMVTDFGVLVTNLGVGGYALVVASYVENGVARTTAVGTPITSVQVNTRIDTQRRRLPSE